MPVLAGRIVDDLKSLASRQLYRSTTLKILFYEKSEVEGDPGFVGMHDSKHNSCASQTCDKLVSPSHPKTLLP